MNAIDLTGTITDFSGPAGPTYTVADGAAAYGTLVPGDSASCTDCYAVEITAAARPQVHWDALSDRGHTGPRGAGGRVPEDLDASHRRQLHRRPILEQLLPAIETVLHNGVTAGCGDGTTYCPADTVTRQQMAVFLLKAKDGAAYVPPDCTTPVFTDVPCSSPFAPWVNELAARGVTAGCGDGTTYCSDGPHQPPADGRVPAEDGGGLVLRPAAVHRAGLRRRSLLEPVLLLDQRARRAQRDRRLRRRQLLPGNQVARQQMAVFLTKTFGLLLYGL